MTGSSRLQYLFPVAGIAALMVFAAGCSHSSAPVVVTGACTKTSDCPAGKACKLGTCTVVPCKGLCSNDEICIDESCKAVEGLDCKDNAAICPTHYVCSLTKVCAHECTEDQDCSTAKAKTCNVDNFYCAECAVNSDCKDAAKPFCDATAAVCVGCLNDASCYKNGQPAGMFCDTTAQVCVNGCHSKADCPPSSKDCLGGTATAVGRCIECNPETEGRDCLDAVKTHCDATSHKCVQCSSDGQCASNHCQKTLHQCVDCLLDPHCPPAHICNASTYSCVDGCAGGSGGGDGNNCPTDPADNRPACDTAQGTHGTCVACLHDADCPRGNICGTANGAPKCKPGCKDDARCAPGPTDGQVTDVQCNTHLGTDGRCVECLNDSQCKSIDPAKPACELTDPDFMGTCRCHKAGEDCTQNTDCGYEVLVIDAAGHKKQDCNAPRGFCLKKVKCFSSGEVSVPAVCTQAGTGLSDQRPADATGCPSGMVNEKGSDGAGLGCGGTSQPSCFSTQCVPNTSPYVCR